MVLHCIWSSSKNNVVKERVLSQIINTTLILLCKGYWRRQVCRDTNACTLQKVLRVTELLFFHTHFTGTEEGKNAEKRVRVYCGICKETRYYSIHRGVTRIGGVVLACEACRHYYQKFKRQPCILRCRDKDSGR